MKDDLNCESSEEAGTNLTLRARKTGVLSEFKIVQNAAEGQASALSPQIQFKASAKETHKEAQQTAKVIGVKQRRHSSTRLAFPYRNTKLYFVQLLLSATSSFGPFTFLMHLGYMLPSCKNLLRTLSRFQESQGGFD